GLVTWRVSLVVPPPPPALPPYTTLFRSSLDFQASTSAAVTQVVNKVATTTTLNSTPNPSTVGQAVTLTATVQPTSGAGVPTGTVTFRDGATAIGSPVALVNGSASMVVSTLAVGSHSLTAAYGGTLDFLDRKSVV